MKKILFFFFLTTLINAHAQRTIINDPNVQTRPVSSFHTIEVSGGIDLYLSQSDEEALAVSATGAGTRDRIISIVENGILKISFKNDGKKWMGGNRNLRAYVAFKTLQKLEASGASDVIVTGDLKADKLDIELSGASDLKASIEANTLHLEQSGASHGNLAGKVATLVIKCSGASELQAYDMEVETCTVKASGASGVRVTVNKELNAEASGASSVKYRGKAVIQEKKASGASSISQ